MPFLGIEMGQIYFEVEIMNAVGAARVGFAGSAFRSNDSSGVVRGKAIGGDDVSWSTYSIDGLGRHRCTRDSFATITGMTISPLLESGSFPELTFNMEQGRVRGDRSATLVPNWDNSRRGC